MNENNSRSGRPLKLIRVLQTAGVILLLAAAIRFIGFSGSCITGLCRVSADDFDDRLAALQKTDQKLVGYTETRRIPTGLKKARGIALDKEGRIYVAGDYGVRIFQSNGGFARDVRLSGETCCVSVAPDGTLYVGMKDHVEVVDKTGKQVASWNVPTRKSYFTSISASAKDIWVGDAGNRAVLRYSPTGMMTGVFAVKDPSKNSPGLILPSPHLDVLAASGGAVWISDPGRHQLEIYTADGKMKRSWGKESFTVEGFSGCCNPTDFALLHDGRFVTSEKGIPRVKVYKADGKFECVVAGRESFTPDVVGLDLVTDAKGHIYVLDPASKSVRVFTSKGKGK